MNKKNISENEWINDHPLFRVGTFHLPSMSNQDAPKIIGQYSPIIDGIISIENDEIIQHERVHRVFSIESSFSAYRRLVGVSHAILNRLIDVTNVEGTRLTGTNLEMLEISLVIDYSRRSIPGSGMLGSALAIGLLKKLKSIEKLIDIYFSIIEPLIEIATIDFTPFKSVALPEKDVVFTRNDTGISDTVDYIAPYLDDDTLTPDYDFMSKNADKIWRKKDQQFNDTVTLERVTEIHQNFRLIFPKYEDIEEFRSALRSAWKAYASVRSGYVRKALLMLVINSITKAILVKHHLECGLVDHDSDRYIIPDPLLEIGTLSSQTQNDPLEALKEFKELSNELALETLEILSEIIDWYTVSIPIPFNKAICYADVVNYVLYNSYASDPVEASYEGPLARLKDITPPLSTSLIQFKLYKRYASDPKVPLIRLEHITYPTLPPSMLFYRLKSGQLKLNWQQAFFATMLYDRIWPKHITKTDRKLIRLWKQERWSGHDWWLELVLSETLRQAIKLDKSVSCPFHGWKWEPEVWECSEDCPIKQVLTQLPKHTDLRIGAICP